MECNKDEAIKAKEIADSKLTEMDITGASKFALKAQNLYPELEGLTDLLASLHVYSSAETKVNGEVDWYGVVGVEPSADDDTIRKHYKHMALALHPDKNKSVGAEGAFKLLSQAWAVLSDKHKKIAYDQKRNFYGMFSKAATGNPSHHNGFPFFPNTNYSNLRDHKPATPQRTPKANNFWTTCPFCGMHFEYSMLFFRINLLCRHCDRQFFAMESRPPKAQYVPYAPWAFLNQKSKVQGKKPVFSGFSGFESTFQLGVYSNLDGVGNVRASVLSASQGSGVAHPSRKHQKRMYEEAEKLGTGLAGESSKSRPKKKRGVDAQRWSGDSTAFMRQTSTGYGIFEAGNVAGKSRAREFSHLGSTKMLSQIAQMNILKKVNQWSTPTASRTDDKCKASDGQVKEKEKINPKPDEKEKERNDKSKPDEEKPLPKAAAVGGGIADAALEDKKKVEKEEVYAENPNVDSDMNSSNLMSMSVPDPDFHDFDGDRTEKSFGDNQVWAAYDDEDGMPRYYAMIHSVISLKPFRMKMSWLNTKSNSELGPMNWVGSGFYKTCGDFRMGKYEIDNSLNSFSHRVKWSKGTKGAILIYPAKGDVWALYRNWSPDWSELTPDEVIRKYDMVEVDEGFDGEGITVAPLVKVAGFKTVFRRHSGTKELIRIPREEMFRLSHQVPSYKLTGQEGENAPEDCLELDPAALPLELIQVAEEEAQAEKSAEAKASLEESKETEKEAVVEDKGKEVKREGLIVYSRRHCH